MAITSSASQRSAITARPRASRKPWGAILLFIAPAVIVYIIFVLYPLLATFYYSLQHIAPSGGKVVTSFVGLKNYQELFKDDIFFQAARNTLLWGAAGPAIEMVVAITLAMLVYFRVPLHRFYRVAWFTPILVSGVIVGLVFRWVFNYDWGILNVGLRAIGLDSWALNWLGRRDTPIWAVIFVHLWATFGYSFILLLAGLSAIPGELLEAAYIDGASKPQTIWHVMLPLLKPTAITVLILSFMGKMHAFHVVWVLTNGGPLHFSETVATYVQKRAFGWSSFDLGYPSAISVVWFGLTVVGVGIISRWLKSRVES
jgi:multiple sugar transport system permease protein/raffinose/stachyose/melibiose transport system permease protein